MCDHHTPAPGLRHGAALEHGAAHTDDHAAWSRRDFLSTLGLGLAGNAFLLGRTPVRAMGRPSLLSTLQALETDHVLVLIQLSGGNDGLNTIVPYGDDRYYGLRPNLSLAASEVLPLSDHLGAHPALAPLDALYGDGYMGIVTNVGYPDPNLSHFRSTDIWLSASDSDVEEPTGWVGRYLDDVWPDAEAPPPESPLAVQLGVNAPMLFQGADQHLGMALQNLDLFERLAAGGELYPTADVPDALYGQEMAFVRSIANDSFQYAGAVQAASEAGANSVAYPGGGNQLAGNLAVIARLIKGNLGTRIYHTALGGFDTHANQAGQHTRLLGYLAEAVAAFQTDLGPDWRERVLVMTFSEFGRRPYENGSRGTDHGTAAPLFLFGGGVRGGLHGRAPALDEAALAAQGGNLTHDVDFRAVYATVLRDWFDLDAATTAALLGHAFEPLPLLQTGTGTSVDRPVLPGTFRLRSNYPNPFNPSTTVAYDLGSAAPVRLEAFDPVGRRVRTLVDRIQPAGAHAARFDAHGLPSGVYLIRLTTPFGVQSRAVTLVK